MFKRFRQAFFVVVTCSLLFASSVAACACSHHIEKKIVKADCHSHVQTTESTQVDADQNICDKNCICAVGQSPYIVLAASSKEFKSTDELANAAHVLTETEFVASNSFTEPPPYFYNSVSYSSRLKSLLPARAPPRL